MQPGSFLEEREILQQIANGDKLAFSKLFNAYHQLLASHIFRLTASVELAEEVVQDVFLKIWNNRQALADVKNVKAYLYVLSKNHALNCLKQVARQRKRERELAIANDYLQQDEDTGATEIYSLFDEAVNHLSDQQKTAYLLSRHNRLTYEQIAARMGISHETVKTYLKRACILITNYINQKNTSFLVVILFKILFFITA